jgi:HEAT repeat protein
MPGMRRRAAAMLAAAVLPAAQAAGGDAIYKGKSAQEWTKELARGNMDAFFALTGPEKEAAAVLGEMLGSEHSPVRAVAAQGLAEIAADAVSLAAPLGHALKDNNLNVRYYAAQALGKMGAAAAPAVPDLIGALDTNPSREPNLEGPPRYYKDARSVAAEALGSIGPPAKAALPRLREVAANDEEHEVREAAAAAIKKIEAK